MEELGSGCVILKKKEYEALINEARKQAPKEIYIRWSYSNHIKYQGYFRRELYIDGDFVLSDKLRIQIGNILEKIDQRVEKEIKEITTECDNELEEQKQYFNNLPWYKRLFKIR